jgi:acetyltransferase-like isoleucine patch superfamily enzyme
MRRDHRPYWMHRFWEQFENWWTGHFLRPHFEDLGTDAKIVRPWHVEIFGPNVRAGRCLHIIASASDPVRLTVWAPQDKPGQVVLGDCVFIAGGTRILAAESIEIGDACLIAREATITDCDWHSLYDRVDPAPPPKPVKLGCNVWIGDGAFIGKGVTIGDHAVIGARSVITKDVEPYCVMAGNPAREVKRLDPDTPMKTRLDLLGDSPALHKFMENAYRDAMKGNSTWGWLRTKLHPRHGD